MKLQIIEKEGPFIDSQGRQHLDSGDIWHRDMPREFWTTEAKQLFTAAEAAGLILWCDEADTYSPAAGITKAQLAYWCKRASTYLGIDRGGTTSWKPFEKVFNGPGTYWRDRAGNPIEVEKQTPLKASLWCLKAQPEFTSKKDTTKEGFRLDQVGAIDHFFENLNSSTNEH